MIASAGQQVGRLRNNLSDLLRMDFLDMKKIAIFKIEFPRHLCALREAVGQGNLKSVQKSGHTLRGMLSNLGTARAAAAAARLERLEDSSDGAALKSALAFFESEVTDLLPELEACVAKARP